MKKLILLPLLFFFGIMTAQELDGAWKLTQKDGKAVNDREVIKIVQDGYFALGSKNLSDDKFLGAAGGELSLEDETLTEIRDFDTYNAENIGTEHEYNISWEGENKMEISDGITTKVWERVSDKSDALTGTWVITGRERKDEMNTMTPGDRRTAKILSGGRFQWIAFNSATKEFNGTGGGTYSAENGTYTENIEFFSRDASRVGASLEFQYEVKDGNWHHKGKSSKGDPIYEIWSPYSEAYQK
ncbi:hypothetical protein [Salegentibacter salegens]|uniref:Membrane or secreted protein n=1 Tax=Salegentibacter salegens TaxID=143223 RepID=A0A1M7LZ10_9FLAO|nr:hypothetical protein [Salegentibacter salegens]PRX52085.1 hypothetical protein LY58_00249 [Salegentibacter salegens]SHM83519.1 hypothetical protein SAMN05878281_2180 [Salegentibacter salegens]